MSAKLSKHDLLDPPDLSRTDKHDHAFAVEPGTWMGYADGTVIFINQTWQSFEAPEIAGAKQNTHWLTILHPEDIDQAQAAWIAATQKNAPLHIKCRLSTPAGWQWHWMCSIALPAQIAQNAWQITATPVQARNDDVQSLTQELQNYRNMLDASVDCIKMLSPEGRVLHMNAAGCRALGVSESEGFGQRWLDLLPQEVRAAGLRALNRAARQGKKTQFAGMSVSGGKTQYWDNALSPVVNAQGEITAIFCLSRDVTLQRQAEKRLRIASEVDALTGLPNRRVLQAQLTRSLRKHNDSRQFVGLMLLDLDHFKHVNDTLGHVAGDHLLRALSKRLQACLPDSAFIARLGGDEFAIVYSGFTHIREFLELARHVHHQIDAPVTYAGKLINGGMSIGCALYPRDAQDLSGLLKAADTALNDIKAGGRGGVQMYSIKMMQSAIRAADQLERSRQIVRDKAIEPHYQPKVTLADDRVIGFEALLRWRDASGLHYPRGVEEAFKNYDAATKISEQMRQKVFSDMARWYQQGLPLLPISLNAAPVEFLRDDYAERLLHSIQQFGLPPTLVEIEVTEHSLTERNAEYVGRSLNVLKKAGVRIALDDFGTGHSSFANLRDYPVDCIKIDRDFIHRMQDETVIAAIVKAVCQLGPALNLQIIAEGVETRQQCNALLTVGCEVGQGFLFSPAMPAEAVEKMLADWKQRFQLLPPQAPPIDSHNKLHRIR
ncbi:putative bifunctional diguanylate cyclase/phosphodiesterase [Lampropedia puyangensis]|nr:EAL domain-containing protein [Lampropedia puyangensis]